MAVKGLLLITRVDQHLPETPIRGLGEGREAVFRAVTLVATARAPRPPLGAFVSPPRFSASKLRGLTSAAEYVLV